MQQKPASQEHLFAPLSGWLMLPLVIAWIPASVWAAVQTDGVALALAIPVFLLSIPGFFVINPNTARVLVLFGRYRGTVNKAGFWWTNPFTVKSRVSLRAHNFNSEKIKVNDLLGNPIEIAAIVVWRVHDTARAKFDVEKYEEFVALQSEAAVRQLASKHPYDDDHTGKIATSLRGSADVVSHELGEMLQQRLEQAGVEVIEARLSHLAYAPEIASAMLQRQQATAIIAARTKIVEGAVGMVELALEQLDKSGQVQLDNERRATLVGNLLVVLCSHENPTPVLNTGSLYN